MVVIYAQARQIAGNGFTASTRWLSRFMHRHHLSVRRGTTTARVMVPAEEELRTSADKFVSDVRRDIRELHLGRSQVLACDQIRILLDPVCKTTVAVKGSHDIPILSWGGRSDPGGLTVHFGCAADGTKLIPMIVFRGDRLPNTYVYPSEEDAIVRSSKNSFMTDHLAAEWLDLGVDWADRNRNGLMIVDSWHGYSSQFHEMAENRSLEIRVMPGKVGAKIDPMDQHIGLSLRRGISTLRESLLKGLYEKFGFVRLKDKEWRDHMTRWIVDTWWDDKVVQPRVIKQAFVKSGYFSRMG